MFWRFLYFSVDDESSYIPHRIPPAPSNYFHLSRSILMYNDNVALLILTGGNSSRFGQKKAFIEFKGKSFIEHIIARTGPLHTELVISCRNGKERLKELFPDAIVVEDGSDMRSPMTGLYSALPHIRSEYVTILPCDVPLIRKEVIQMLIERALGHDAAVPVWPNGYLEPLTAVYATGSLLQAVKVSWKEGLMRISNAIGMLQDVVFISTEEIKELDPDLQSFININSPADLTALELIKEPTFPCPQTR